MASADSGLHDVTKVVAGALDAAQWNFLEKQLQLDVQTKPPQAERAAAAGTAAGTAGTAVPARPHATAVAAATARAKVAAATSAAQHARRSQFQQRHGRKGHPRSEEGAWPLPRDPQNRGRSRRSALNQPTRRGHGSPGMMHGGPSTGRRCQTRTTGRSAGRRGQAVDAVS